jgi:alginate O-acetyltransferase complex protein AlgI
MLFNSYVFIFVFLPITAALFFALGARWPAMAAGWLALASLAFYAYWNPAYVALLLGSIAFNFAAGRYLMVPTAPVNRKLVLTVAVTINLGLLAYYKYANFFVDNVNELLGFDWTLAHVILPLGISFFTFTQVAFLVDAYRGQVREYNVIHYVLFVTYFPHLIAGPVLHHKEMMPQFSLPKTYRFSAENFAVGITLFIIGLAKKVLLADNIAVYVSPVFDAAAHGQSLTFVEAWGGALAYTLQLYFDFSGYSDMAIGLSRLFGIRLPLNFDSPYKSPDIIEFWRRWHMTLSRFLRDYLYIPLGGNRFGNARRYSNLLITMLLGGLWHGAGWTYVIWGGLHGVYLIINHGWLALRTRSAVSLAPGPMRSSLSVLLTFTAVVIAWVFFRAESCSAAMRVLEGMAGVNGLVLPQGWAYSLPAFAMTGLGWLGFTLGDPGQFKGLGQLAWLAIGLAVVWFSPNSQQIMAAYRPYLESERTPDAQPASKLLWRPALAWSLPVAATAALVLASLGRISEFLYFQF